MPPVTLIHNDTFCLREELAAYVRCVPTAFIQHDTQLDNRSVPIVNFLKEAMVLLLFLYIYFLHLIRHEIFSSIYKSSSANNIDKPCQSVEDHLYNTERRIYLPKIFEAFKHKVSTNSKI